MIGRLQKKYQRETINMFSLSKHGRVICSQAPQTSCSGFDEVHEWQVFSSEDKEEIISRVERIIEGNDEHHEFLRQRAALMADEMLENALYCAPRDLSGNQIYAKGEKRSLSSGENILVRCAFDGERLFLEVSDSWGKLAPETVQGYIAINLAHDTSTDRAGRGLYFMWKFMKDFYVNFVPGLKTSVGGYLLLNPDTYEYGAT
jgi:hypothetical protein